MSLIEKAFELYEVRKKFWEDPDLVEMILPSLDPESTLFLAKEGEEVVAQALRLKTNLVRVLCRELGEDMKDIWDVEEEEGLDLDGTSGVYEEGQNDGEGSWIRVELVDCPTQLAFFLLTSCQLSRWWQPLPGM